MHRTRIQTFVGLMIVILIMIFFHYIGWLSPIENIIRGIINPGSSVLYTLSDTDEFSSVEELYQAYTTLKANEKKAEYAQTKAELLEEENTSLRRQLNFFATSTYHHVGADVIAKDVDPVVSTIVINQGTKQGIDINDPVVVYDGIIIGKIIRAEKETAVVQLMNDSQSKIAATILNKDYSIGLVEGGYGISIRMNFIPQNENIAVEDSVVTSGLEEGIPRGLLIGSVEAVEKEAYQPFQRAVITPAASLQNIRTVSVITEIR